MKIDLAQSGVAWTYDFTGYEQIKVELCTGDIVRWKRNGQRGMLTCRVLGFSKGKIHLQPLDYRTGADTGRSVAAFPSVSDPRRNGAIVGLPEPFIGVVTAYSFDPAKNYGELSVARPDHREVFLNNGSHGWPQQVISIGEQVRVTATPDPVRDHAYWKVEKQ